MDTKIDHNKFLTDKGQVEEIKGSFCLGHWKPYKPAHSMIPSLLEFKEVDYKDLSFIHTSFVRDDEQPYYETYYFLCNDITLGPSDKVRLWKVEPKVAA